MAETKINRMNNFRDDRLNLIAPVMLLWGIALLGGCAFLWYDSGSEFFGDYYLLPWCLISGIVILAPSAYFLHKGQFNLFNPLVFAAWSYIFPAFVIGGVMLSFGWSDPYYLTFVENPRYELPLSLMYVTLGYLGIVVGYFLSPAKKFGKFLERRLPRWDWQPSEVWLGGLLLIVAGFGINILGFIRGIVGFQRAESVEAFDGLLIFLLIVLSEGTVLLWLAVFQTKQRTGVFYLVLAILIAIIPLRVAVLGSRSGFVLSLFPIVMAFVFSGRKLKWQHTTILSVGLVIAVCVGMIYGTTFRNIKGSEDRINAGDYFGQVAATIEYLSETDPLLILEEGAQAMALRVENLSAVGVVVSNYEKLAPYEEAYGLQNNIINDLLYSFVPRFIYPEKPNTSDTRAYSDLYFNYGENAWTVTPFGDLLRNFGPIGIPLGMMLVGMYLRVIYSTLIETENPAMWKTVAYYPLLTVISYESFYAILFPSIIRVLFVLVISLWLVNLTVKLMKRAGK
jgi:hypothetical protein